RNAAGKIILDNDARLKLNDGNGRPYLCSAPLSEEILADGMADKLLFLLLEQSDGVLRVTAQIAEQSWLVKLATARPELRLDAYDLPPVTATEIEPVVTR